MAIKKKAYNKKIVVHFLDNSVFIVDGKDKLSALKMKLRVSNLSIKKFMSIFIKDVERHWTNKTVPTKFSFDITWEKDFWGDIFHEYLKKYNMKKENEIRKEVGKFTYITGRENFERDVREKNLKVIEDGVAVYTENSFDPDKILEKGKRIITWDSARGKKYDKIQNKYFELAKREADKDIIKRRHEIRDRFKNRSELAKIVFYQYVRPYLLGILLSKARKGNLGSVVTSEGSSNSSISLVGKNFMIHKKFRKAIKKNGE